MARLAEKEKLQEEEGHKHRQMMLDDIERLKAREADHARARQLEERQVELPCLFRV
jgi:hypothetical protein